MKALARKAAAVVTLLLIVAALAGCVRIDINLKINGDGSADYGMDMLMAEDALALANAQGQDIWAQTTREMEAAGFTVTPKQAEGYSGITVARHYDDPSLIGAGDGLAMGDDGRFAVQAKKGFFGTAYAIDADLDASGILGSQQELQDLAAQMADQVELKMNITLPVKALSHNATSVSADGLTYTWVMKPGQPNRIELAVSIPNTKNMLLAGGGVLAVVLVLVVVIVVVVLSAKKRKNATTQKMRGRVR